MTTDGYQAVHFKAALNALESWMRTQVGRTREKVEQRAPADVREGITDEEWMWAEEFGMSAVAVALEQVALADGLTPDLLEKLTGRAFEPVGREQVAAKIKDAYYAERDAGGTMHTAADKAADAVLELLR